jgi:hypothetical protein
MPSIFDIAVAQCMLPVAHQIENRIDALAGEGLGEHLVDRQVAHGASSFICLPGSD